MTSRNIIINVGEAAWHFPLAKGTGQGAAGKCTDKSRDANY
jgi:hypothetical protein